MVAPTLEDTFWHLVSIDGVPVQAVPGGRSPHLVLFAGRVNANSGCNKVLAPYSLPAAGRLVVGTLASTGAACPDGYAGQETAYLNALAATRHYQLATGAQRPATLWLGDSGQPRRLEFHERVAP